MTSAHGPDFDNSGDDVPHILTCQHCHAGGQDNTFETMEEAHAGMIVDPSDYGESGCVACHEPEFAESACDGCHSGAVDANRNSLHTKLWGEIRAIETRGRCTFEGSGYEDDFEAKCASCHTTCGQCHISRPKSVGGGFPYIGSYYSHRFRESPDMNEQCTACHGSRVGVDYKGELEGNEPDLHRSAGMKCEDCHTKEEIHGDPTHTEENHYNHRYEVTNMPRCENCHSNLANNNYHSAHVDGFATNMQCQVCHSQPYKNCTNCHNLVADEKTDKFDINPSVIQFKIGRNPSPHRTEYDNVVVRHVPVDPDTYADWGLELPGYLDESTWRYTSPHNVLRWTEQTMVEDGQSCGTSCHGSPDGADGFLLREIDLYEVDGITPLPDYGANLDVLIPASFPSKAVKDETAKYVK